LTFIRCRASNGDWNHEATVSVLSRAMDVGDTFPYDTLFHCNHRKFISPPKRTHRSMLGMISIQRDVRKKDQTIFLWVLMRDNQLFGTKVYYGSTARSGMPGHTLSSRWRGKPLEQQCGCVNYTVLSTLKMLLGAGDCWEKWRRKPCRFVLSTYSPPLLGLGVF